MLLLLADYRYIEDPILDSELFLVDKQQFACEPIFGGMCFSKADISGSQPRGHKPIEAEPDAGRMKA